MCAVPHPAEGYCSRCHYCNIIYCGEFPGQGGAKRLVDEDEQGRGEEAALLDSPLKPVLEVFIPSPPPPGATVPPQPGGDCHQVTVPGGGGGGWTPLLTNHLPAHTMQNSWPFSCLL